MTLIKYEKARKEAQVVVDQVFEGRECSLLGFSKMTGATPMCGYSRAKTADVDG